MRTTVSRVRRVVGALLNRLVVPFVPARWKLPALYYVHAYTEPCEQELLHLAAILPRGNVALDIGANRGFYALRLAKLCTEVHAFEPNASLTQELADYGAANAHIHEVGISSAEGEATLYIPRVHGQLLTGWASVVPGNCPGADDHIEQRIPLRTLDSFGFTDVSFIKIDVEGHELEALEGARETIAAERPLVLVEAREDHVQAMRRFFTELGYDECPLMSLVGVEGSEGNYLFRAGSTGGARHEPGDAARAALPGRAMQEST